MAKGIAAVLFNATVSSERSSSREQHRFTAFLLESTNCSVSAIFLQRRQVRVPINSLGMRSPTEHFTDIGSPDIFRASPKQLS